MVNQHSERVTKHKFELQAHLMLEQYNSQKLPFTVSAIAQGVPKVPF